MTFSMGSFDGIFLGIFDLGFTGISWDFHRALMGFHGIFDVDILDIMGYHRILCGYNGISKHFQGCSKQS